MICTTPLTTEQFIEWSADREHPYELMDGNPVIMPPERYFNTLIARLLARSLESSFGFHQITTSIELEVQSRNTRIPDLCVVSDQVAKQLAKQSRAMIRLGMEPPLIAVEVVSPGSSERDYQTKRNESAAISIPEYWILDPDRRAATLDQLTRDRKYDSVEVSRLTSITVSDLLALIDKADEILSEGL